MQRREVKKIICKYISMTQWLMNVKIMMNRMKIIQWNNNVKVITWSPRSEIMKNFIEHGSLDRRRYSKVSKLSTVRRSL